MFIGHYAPAFALNAAVFLVQLDLAVQHLPEQALRTVIDGQSGFIAGGLQPQYPHGVLAHFADQGAIIAAKLAGFRGGFCMWHLKPARRGRKMLHFGLTSKSWHHPPQRILHAPGQAQRRRTR